jgi:hypothetical protein
MLPLEIRFLRGLGRLTVVILLTSTSTVCNPVPSWSERQRKMASLCCERPSSDRSPLLPDVLCDVGEGPQTLPQRYRPTGE